MFRLNKAVVALMIIFSLFTLAGCNAEQEKTQPQPQEQQQQKEQVQQVTSKYKFESVTELPAIARQNTKSVIAPVGISNTTYSNGIKFEYIKYPGADTSAGNPFNYMKISGLVNKEVENKINQKLYDEYVTLYNRGLPPYRGIRQIATDDKDVNISIVYEAYSSNISNILSVNITKEITVQNKQKKEYNYLSDVTALNFNLNNGELLALADLFADNCDYKKIINGQINKYMLSRNIDGGDSTNINYDEMVSGNLKMVSPFTGITDNQKYYIQGENIYILVDYNMPQFDTNYRCMPIVIDSRNPEVAINLALFKRFETNDESLYDGTVKREKRLRDLTYDSKTDRIMYGTAKDLGLDYQDLEVSFFASMPKQIEIKEINDIFNKKYSEARSKFIEMIKEKKSLYPNNRMMVYSDYYIREMGKYLVEEENSSVYVIFANEKENKHFQTVNSGVFDKKTGNKINLSDVFRDGFDYKKAIIDICQKNNQNNNYWKLTNQELSNIIELNNFRLNAEGIDISDVSNKSDHVNSFSVTYKDLGYENLTRFD